MVKFWEKFCSVWSYSISQLLSSCNIWPNIMC